MAVHSYFAELQRRFNGNMAVQRKAMTAKVAFRAVCPLILSRALLSPLIAGIARLRRLNLYWNGLARLCAPCGPIFQFIEIS